MAYTDNKYKIRPGTWTEKDMQSDLYAVTAFPRQADQPLDIPWYPPIEPDGLLSEVEEVVDALDGSRSGFGGYNEPWLLALCTPLMTTYVRTYIFNGGWSAPVTVVTWDRGYGWRTLNCTALWNEPAKTAVPGYLRGYHKLRIDFVQGVAAAQGVAFSSAFSSAFDTL